MIVLDHLSKAPSSGSAKTALRDVSIEIKEGEILGILGEAGSGKTALAQCLALLEPPGQGNIFYNDINVYSTDSRTLSTLRRSIGVVFSDPGLLASRSIYQNVALPLQWDGRSRGECRRFVDPLLKRLGLTSVAEFRPPCSSRRFSARKQR